MKEKNKVVEHLHKHWKNYLLVIAAAIIVYLILNGNKGVDTHRTEASINDKDYKAVHDILKESDKQHAIDVRAIIVLGANLRAKNEEAAATRHELDKTKAVANRLSREVRELQPEDTSLYAHKVDSLAQQTDDLAEQVVKYEGQVDSLNTLYTEQKITYEKMIDDKVKINELLRTSYDKVKVSYDGLYTDYGKLSKQVKRERFKTKAAALIALAAVGFLIAK